MRRALDFLGLIDHKANLSLTNLALIVIVCQIALAGESVGWPISAALLFALGNYAHKRIETRKAEAAKTELAKYEDLRANQARFTERLFEFEAGFDKVAKQAEDTKQLLSATHVGHAFGVNRRPRVEKQA